jgi:hypothetical protein
MLNCNEATVVSFYTNTNPKLTVIPRHMPLSLEELYEITQQLI